MSYHAQDYKDAAANVLVYVNTKPGLFITGFVVGLVVGAIARG